MNDIDNGFDMIDEDPRMMSPYENDWVGTMRSRGGYRCRLRMKGEFEAQQLLVDILSDKTKYKSSSEDRRA